MSDDGRSDRWTALNAHLETEPAGWHDVEWAVRNAVPEDAATATTGESVVRGGLWNTFALGLPQFFTLIMSITAARVLTPAGMGTQSYISFVSLSAPLVLTTGISLALVRFVAELAGSGRHDAIRELARWARHLTVVAAAGAGLLVWLFASLNGTFPAAWLFAAIVAMAGSMQIVPEGILLGLQRWRDASIAGLVTTGISTVAIVVVLLAGGGITGLFGATAIFTTAGVLWTWWLARRAVRDLPRRPDGPVPELRTRFGRFALMASCESVLAYIVWRRTEFFFLEALSTTEQIALYSIAFAFVTALMQIPEALKAVLSPAFATLFGARDFERIRRAFGRATRIVLLAALPLTAAGLALGPLAIRIVYGSEYAGTRPVLIIMMVAFPLLPIFAVANAVLIGLDRIRIPVIAAAVAATIDVTLALVLVPRLDAVGAALANVAAQLAVAIPVLIAAVRLVGGVEWRGGSIARAAVASVFAFVAAALAELVAPNIVGLVAGTIAMAVVFTIAARVLRIVTPEDARWLRDIAGDRWRPAVDRVYKLLAVEG